MPVKTFTPSMASSGYGSQAVSTQTLSSEDSTSVRSTDDTPEPDTKHGDKTTASGGLEMGDSCDETTQGGDDLLGGTGEVGNQPDGDNSRHSLQRSSSLIDTDVPANLGSPLQPTPTVEFGECDLTPQVNMELGCDSEINDESADGESQESVVAAITDDGGEPKSHSVGSDCIGESANDESAESVMAAMMDDGGEPTSHSVGNDCIGESANDESTESVVAAMMDDGGEPTSHSVGNDCIGESANDTQGSLSSRQSVDDVLHESTAALEESIPRNVDLNGESAAHSVDSCGQIVEDELISQSIDVTNVQDNDHQEDVSQPTRSVGDSVNLESMSLQCQNTRQTNVDLDNSNDSVLCEVLSVDKSSHKSTGDHSSESQSNEAIESNTNKKSTDISKTNASKVAGEVKLRKKKNTGSCDEERSVLRRSWADRTPDTIPENSTLNQVKMRKSTSAFAVDPAKPQSLKVKTRSEKSKGGMSPLKATYRPVSMPIEMLSLEESGHSEKSEDGDSGKSDGDSGKSEEHNVPKINFLFACS